MKKRKNPALLAALLMLAAAVGATVFYVADRSIPNNSRVSLSDYYHLSGEEEAGLVIDGAVSEEPARILEGELYLPCEMVRERIDPGLYYDAQDNLLIITEPEEIRTVPADGTDPAFRLKNEIPYVSAAFVEENCPVRIASGGEPLRLNLCTAESILEASVLKDGTVLRNGAGIKSPVLGELSGDARVRILKDQETEEGWMAVVTEDGLSGFVEAGSLSEAKETESHLPNVREYTHLLSEGRLSLAFHQVTDQASNEALPSYLKEVSGITAIAPTWFFLDSGEGAVTSLANEKYVKRARKKGLGVWAVFNDFDGTVSGTRATGEALSSRSRREKLIAAVVEGVLSVGADGICIDFENVTAAAAPDFIEFLRELSVSCRREGLVLSVCNYIPSFTKYYDRKGQVQVVDYVICMCYDEHTKNSANAGSVSSLPFVESGIADTLKEVPKEQLIAALPFYTRIWKSRGSAVEECRAVGMDDAAEWVEENGLTVSVDEAAGQHYASKKEEDITEEVWLEDRYSLGEKLKLIEAEDLAGTAVWKLGFENADIWTLFEEYLDTGDES